MTTHRKPTAREELERIESALIESLMNCAEQDLREELAAAGDDPDARIAEIEAAIAQAKSECARRRMEGARAELAAWREKSQAAATGDKSEGVKARFERMRSGTGDLDSKMMLAARKGEGLSERDLESLLDDIAELERLEHEKGDE